jgi:hypothetical protein
MAEPMEAQMAEAQTPSAPHARVKQVATRAKHTFTQLAVRILFLWAIFGLFELDHAIVLGDQHIDYLPHGLALINAIVMSKVLLIAEEMNFASQFHERRLIFSILWKAALFSLLFMVIHMIEETIKRLVHGDGLSASLPHPASIAVVACTAAMLFIALTPYFAFREVGRVIGEQKLNDLIFKERPKDSAF